MIALDTNVLLRFAVDDGSPEAAFAHGILPDLAKTAPAFYLSVPVLCESTWVLRGSFKYRRSEIAEFIEHLLADPLFSLESTDAVATALAAYRETRCDYADCIIAEFARRVGCSHILTFDRAMRALPNVQVLQPGSA